MCCDIKEHGLMNDLGINYVCIFLLTPFVDASGGGGMDECP